MTFESKAMPAIGLNRFDFGSPKAFAEDVARAESHGWGWAFIPASSLKLRDPYVNLAFAAQATNRIGLGVLLDNPLVREPGVLASSISTVDELAPGRTMLSLGAGDTAVRLLGRRPARVAELEGATQLCRQLLAGESVDVGAQQPASMAHARRVPLWIAAGGPRTLRMAGRVADGVWIRVGHHPANLLAAYSAVMDGAKEAGRGPGDISIGLIFHTVWDDDAERARCIAMSMAAGYYEYSPTLFDAPGFSWDGPDVHALKKRVWPDFHHHPDLLEAGELVGFLSEEIADAFALRGNAEQIASQLADVLSLDIPIDIILPHPVPTPQPGVRPDFIERFPSEIMPSVRRRIAGNTADAR